MGMSPRRASADSVFHTEQVRASKIVELKEFDGVFLEVVEDSLRQVLGERAVKLILLHLERENGLKREEIPSNIDAFSSGLAELIGVGAPFLERLVIKLLCSRLKLVYEAKSELRFTDRVERLRKRYEG